MNNLIYFNPDQKNYPVYQNDNGIIEFFKDYDEHLIDISKDTDEDFDFDDFDDDEWDFCSNLLNRFLVAVRNLKPHLVKIGYVLLMLAALPFLVSFVQHDEVKATVYYPNPTVETPVLKLMAAYPADYNDVIEQAHMDEITLDKGVLDVYDPESLPIAVALARTGYLEARGIQSQTEQACVFWTVLNRVDDSRFGNTIMGVLTAPNQFAHSNNVPTVDDYGRDLVKLAQDVLFRWKLENHGYTNVGRVLPKEYVFFSGDGVHNYFVKSLYDGTAWDYSLQSPYES